MKSLENEKNKMEIELRYLIAKSTINLLCKIPLLSYSLRAQNHEKNNNILCNFQILLIPEKFTVVFKSIGLA